jgi:tRNA threonylcarbamoyladenosine biosynthesis protein TsaB
MLLAIDTCGATGTVTLGSWDGETLTGIAQAEVAAKTFSAQLIPKIRELLASHSAMAHDLQAIVVVNGPGSFTGVRIGVSTAKGLAEALRIPVVALSRLALLARKAGTHAALLDAGRSEFYFGHYADRQKVEAQKVEMLMSAEEWRQYAGEPIAICEAGIAPDWAAARLVPPPDAADALSAAISRLRAKDYDDVNTLDGNYVRRSDAELFARPAVGQK